MQHIGTQTIETARLVLRKFSFADTESVWRNFAGDEQVQNDYGEPVYKTVEDTKLLLKKYINAYEKPETYRWGAFLKDEPENCIGMVAYFLVDTHNQFCEIEYCIGKQFQNKGYISEAVKAITDYAFNKVGFNRVQVSCRSVNIPSKRVIEKCEFTYEGTLRQFFNHLGQFQDRMYYSLLREEWKNGTQGHKTN
jgi:[ribosomal protein S5]-alanine N-acetyltransferase